LWIDIGSAEDRYHGTDEERFAHNVRAIPAGAAVIRK
jgi:hypothetical protein